MIEQACQNYECGKEDVWWAYGIKTGEDAEQVDIQSDSLQHAWVDCLWHGFYRAIIIYIIPIIIPGHQYLSPTIPGDQEC